MGLIIYLQTCVLENADVYMQKVSAVMQEGVMDVKLDEYAVEVAQKAVDLCRAELHRLLIC